MVHDSKKKLKALAALIREHVSPQPRHHEVSGVKGDGTVVVRFRSGEGVSAHELRERFVGRLVGSNLAHVVIDDNRVRLVLAEL